MATAFTNHFAMLISNYSNEQRYYNMNVVSENATLWTNQNNVSFEKIALGTFLSVFMLWTIFGNCLVIIAVLKERYLRSITNYFIVSLAIADLFMGSIVMPFAIAHQVLDGGWPFGANWCDVWHAMDVLSSTASILNLCMISMERFWATENPIRYPTKMTARRCCAMITAVWLLSSIISFPAIIWWRLTSAHQTNTCNFTDDKTYIIISSTVSFYVPLVIMVMVYCRIYQTASNLVRSLNSGARVMYKNGQHGEKMVLRIHRGRKNISLDASSSSYNARELMSSSCSNHKSGAASGNNGTSQRSFLSLPGQSPAKLVDNLDSDVDSAAHLLIHQASEDDSGSQTQSTNHTIAKKLRRFAVGKRLSKFAREQKAAKTLGIVMGIFIVCWLPFFVCNIILVIDGDAFGRHKDNLLAVVTWFGYVNSGINPAIYAHSMRDFRRAFVKLLCSWWLCRRWALNHADNRLQHATPSRDGGLVHFGSFSSVYGFAHHTNHQKDSNSPTLDQHVKISLTKQQPQHFEELSHV